MTRSSTNPNPPTTRKLRVGVPSPTLQISPKPWTPPAMQLTVSVLTVTYLWRRPGLTTNVKVQPVFFCVSNHAILCKLTTAASASRALFPVATVWRVGVSWSYTAEGSASVQNGKLLIQLLHSTKLTICPPKRHPSSLVLPHPSMISYAAPCSTGGRSPICGGCPRARDRACCGGRRRG